MKKNSLLFLGIALCFICGLIGLVYKVLGSYKIPVEIIKTENLKATANKNFGIDISHYQGVIDWEEMSGSKHDINYIFVRATMGKDGKDLKFYSNWQSSKEHNYLRGAYHYYRPNENSTKQFHNFSNLVKLEHGDFAPVLDIEEMSVYGKENLIAGIRNWLKLAEEHYGITPIVYTGADFYQQHLKDRIDEYPLWIAAYSNSSKLQGIDWKFHQFSDKIRVKGIRAYVDGNSFNGELTELFSLCINDKTLTKTNEEYN
jgi:lysozyme